jgi:CheY-like chemotaxis protein
MMPELDGIEAMRALRLNPATSRTPIIVVTAVDGAHQQALQAGANDIVPKHIDIRRLVAKVDTLLQPPLA